MELRDQRPEVPAFLFHTAAPWEDFASLAIVPSAAMNSFVSLVLRVHMTKEKTTSGKGEPYLVVHGIDMDGCTISPLRLWRFEASDVRDLQVRDISSVDPRALVNRVAGPMRAPHQTPCFKTHPTISRGCSTHAWSRKTG